MTIEPTPLPALSHIACTQRDDGICEIVFKDTTQIAVDEWAVYQLHIDALTPRDQTVFELVDVSIGIPAIGYVIDKARRTIATHSRGRIYYTAILYPVRQRVALNLFVSVINGLRLQRVHLRLFPSTERADAVAWLLDHRARPVDLPKFGVRSG